MDQWWSTVDQWLMVDCESVVHGRLWVGGWWSIVSRWLVVNCGSVVGD